MKRLFATLSVGTALVLSGVATAPASAGTVSYDGVTLECVQTTAGAAKYTLTYTLKGKTHEFTYTLPNAKCLI